MYISNQIICKYIFFMFKSYLSICLYDNINVTVLIKVLSSVLLNSSINIYFYS